MKPIYLAPMEGVTTHIYRRLLNKYYPGIAKFYTPFLSPNQTKSFQMKEIEEIDNEKNAGMITVPQMMCNNPEYFIWACKEVICRGYKEVNLNLGCPSNTVVAKKKGSGFLLYPDELKQFFDTVFSAGLPVNISIKTRLGKNDPDEFKRLLAIYNEFDFSEIILHSRIQKDYYKEEVRKEWFDYAYENSKNRLVFNGDIYNNKDIDEFSAKYPNNPAIMMGRGIISRPYLFEDGEKLQDKEKFKAFNEELLSSYCERMSGDFSILCKLKELWYYMLPALLVDEAYEKKIRKVSKVVEYRALVNEIIDACGDN